MDMRRFFARHPVFTTSDFHEAAEGASLRAVQERIRRAVEREELIRVRNNLFAVVPPDVDAELFEPDRFQLMAALRNDAVFCGHSALELLGVAYSVWNECLAYSKGRREAFRYRSIRYRPIAPPTSLEATGFEGLGLIKLDRAGVFVQSLGAERVLIEGFRSPHQYGGLSEFLASVQSLDEFNPELILRILAIFNERRLYGSVGWFLSSRDADANLLEALEAHRPPTPLYLDRTMGPARKVSRWNFLIPERLTRMEELDAVES